MGRIFAGTLGLLAFITMLARGMTSGSAGGSLMLCAVVSMFAFAGIGWIAGTIAQSTIDEAVRRQFDAEVAASEAEAEA